MADVIQRPAQFRCPACPLGLLLLSVEMEDHTIYTCDGERCGASLWVPTDRGRVLSLAEQLRIARIKLASTLRKMTARFN